VLVKVHFGIVVYGINLASSWKFVHIWLWPFCLWRWTISWLNNLYNFNAVIIIIIIRKSLGIISVWKICL